MSTTTEDAALLARAAHALRPGAERAELRAALEAMAARLERLVQVHDDTAAERAALRRVAAAARDFFTLASGVYDPKSEWAIELAAALAAHEGRPLRAGDHVRHVPSGEEWVIAYQDGEYVAWCGWPEGEARAADCELIWAATDAEHRATLERIAELDDKRGRMARAALEGLR